MPAKIKPKKEKPSYTDFKIMLYVDSDGIPHWQNGATDYFDAIGKCEQRRAYNMNANREQDMREAFDYYQNAPKLEPKPKKHDAAQLEKKYGKLIRNLHRYKHVPVEQLAEQFKLSISDVKTMVKGTSSDEKLEREGIS